MSTTTEEPPTTHAPTTEKELAELKSFLDLSISSTEDPTGPELIDDTYAATSPATEKPPLFAPGATLRRQRHRRVITADWREFIATVEKKEDGTLIIPAAKDGAPPPKMCTNCGAHLEDDEPHCKV